MHTHHCEVCKQVVASCSDEHCQGDTGHFCTAHHPDPQFQRVDPPTVRMHVKVVAEETAS